MTIPYLRPLGLLLLGLGVACGTPEGPDASLGSLRVAVSGLPADAAPELTVTGPDGFAQTVAGTTTLTDLELGDYAVEAPELTVGEDLYTSTVTPSSALVEAGLTSTISVVYTEETPVGPRITALAIEGYAGSLQIRQGAGLVTLEITGEELAGATLARLGGLGGDVDANNASSVVATFDIGPDTPVGPLALEIVVDAGIATLTDAVEVTATTAAGTGDDATGRGTPDQPLRSIAAALALAPAGGDIVLLPGTYDEANGETFPIAIDDRRLVGSGADNTIVSGPGDESGIYLGGAAATVADLQIHGFTTGVRAQGGDVTLQGLEVWGNTGDGFSASTNTVTPVTSVSATDCVFRNNGLHGFEASTPPDSPVSYSLANVTSADNGQRGIYLVQSVQMTLDDSTIEGNDFQGISLIQNARLDATGITVRDNDLEGVLGTGNTTLRLEGGLVRGQQQHGIEFSGASLWLRDSEVLNNVAGAIRIAGSPLVDLGTLADPGNNVVGVDGAGISLGSHLHDDRSADSDPAISAVGVDLGATPAPAGLVTGPDEDAPFWAIDHDGNQIDFGN